MDTKTNDVTIVRCGHCGAKNRIDQRARQAMPRCGRCGTALQIPSNQASSHQPVELNDQTFDKMLRDAGSLPLMIDCWAPWCGPCRMLAPTVDALAQATQGQWIIAKLNVDHSPQTASRFQISSIPTLLFFKQGKLVDRVVGLAQREALESRLRRLAN